MVVFFYLQVADSSNESKFKVNLIKRVVVNKLQLEASRVYWYKKTIKRGKA